MTRAGIFGWSYPAGCSSLPWDDEMEMPEPGDQVILDDLVGVVVDCWFPDDDEKPDWVRHDEECVLVQFAGEDKPRPCTLVELEQYQAWDPTPGPEVMQHRLGDPNEDRYKRTSTDQWLHRCKQCYQGGQDDNGFIPLEEKIEHQNWCSSRGVF